MDAAKQCTSLLGTCARGQWQADSGVARAVLAAPVRIGAREVLFQIDTGSDVSMVYGRHLLDEKTSLEEVGNKTWAMVDLRFAGQAKRAHRVLVNEGMSYEPSDPESLAGTLGLDFFVGMTTMIDLSSPGGVLICIVEDAEGLMARSSEAKIRHGKLFMSVRVGERRYDNLFFDTGASSTQLVVDRELWRKLTGLDGGESRVTERSVESWGKTITIRTALLRHPLEVGGIRRTSATASYIREQPRLFASWPFATQGLIGNETFAGHVIALDLRASSARFAVLAPPCRRTEPYVR